MPHPRLSILAILLLAGVAWGSDIPKAKDLAVLYQPYRTGLMALAPDGRHLAYSMQAGRIVLVDIDRPAEKVTVIVGGGRNAGSRSPMASSAPVSFLRWVTATRLVYLAGGTIQAVDADGRNNRELANSGTFSYSYSPLPEVVGSGENSETVSSSPVEINQQFRALGTLADNSPLLVAGTDDKEALKQGQGGYRSFKVDIATGKIERLPDPIGDRPIFDSPRLLHDRQGRTRILETPAIPYEPPLPDGTRSPQALETQYYRHYPQTGGDWRTLDAVLGPATVLYFSHGAEDYHRPRSFPLAFDADPNVLYIASNVGRDTFGIYSLDLTAGKRTDFAVEVPGCDLALPGSELSEKPLVFDRRYRLMGVRQPGRTPGTRWFDADLARVQGELENDFPGRTASIFDWDEAKKRFLVLVTGPGDPGRYFVYQTGRPGLLMEYVRRAPGLAADLLENWPIRPFAVNPPDYTDLVLYGAGVSGGKSSAAADEAEAADSSVIRRLPRPQGGGIRAPVYQLAVTEPFAFDTPAGVRLTGSITLPKQHRGKLPPLLLYCHDFPDEGRVGLEFNPDVEALANCGLMVVQVNYRGTPGFGLKHRDAVREEGFDRAPVEDLRATVAWMAGRHQFDPKRVALVGEGFGGHVALRALQLYPGEFRCAATLDAPTDLASWVNEATVASAFSADELLPRCRAFFGVGAEKLKAMSALEHAGQTVRPVLLVQNENGLIVRASQASGLRNALERLGREVEYYKYNGPENDYRIGNSMSMSKPKIMVRIGAFLMDSLYKYRVDIGEAKEER